MQRKNCLAAKAGPDVGLVAQLLLIAPTSFIIVPIRVIIPKNEDV